MVDSTTIRDLNATFPQKTNPLVAVFLGGTSGIGEHTLRALASAYSPTHGTGLRVYLVGRNSEAAAEIIAECVKLCPKGEFKFVKAGDLSLLREVDGVCREVSRMEREVAGQGAKVDLLVMSMACVVLGPRRETKEGLAKLQSLTYYARMRTITNLLPLLLSSSLPSAHIISIYAAGTETRGTLHPTDLSLRNPRNFSFLNLRSHAVYMTTFFFDTLAERHKGRLSFVHVFPGLVMTKAFRDPEIPWWFRGVWWVLGPVLGWLVAVPQMECGERVLFLTSEKFPARCKADGGGGGGDREGGVELKKVGDGKKVALGYDGKPGSGVYSVGQDSEAMVLEDAYGQFRKEGMREKVWEHTMRVFGEIEREGVFGG